MDPKLTPLVCLELSAEVDVEADVEAWGLCMVGGKCAGYVMDGMARRAWLYLTMDYVLRGTELVRGVN